MSLDLGSHLCPYFSDFSEESRSKCHPEPPDVALVKLKDGLAPQKFLICTAVLGYFFGPMNK